MATFCFSAALLFGLLTIYPFILYPALLWVLRALGVGRPAAVGRDDRISPAGLSMALCFCAYKEEKVIADKIANIAEIRKNLPDLEVRAYVDGVEDRTGEILAAAPDIRTTVSPLRQGKTTGMNLLVQQTEADIVVFTDANVMLDPEALPRLRAYFADPDVGCVCGRLIYTGNETDTAAVNAAYWNLEEAIKQLESDTGSLMGADGSIFAIRRALHRQVPDDLIDDMYVSLSILCDGKRLVRAPDVLAYEKSASASADEFRRKVRIACQAVNVHRALWPRLKQLGVLHRFKYVSHKLIRWMTIYWMALTILFGLGFLGEVGLLPLGLAVLAAGALALLAGRLFGLGPFAKIYELLSAFCATGLGVVRSFQGHRFRTWEPAASVRS